MEQDSDREQEQEGKKTRAENLGFGELDVSDMLTKSFASLPNFRWVTQSADT